MSAPPRPADTPQPATPRRGAALREVRLEELLCGERDLLIRHGEELYHLRITKNGRLLLTK